MILLTSDWHLTDNPADEYRWRVIDEVHRVIENETVGRVYVLGDLCDRKDRHSSELVNRMVEALRSITEAGVTLTILKGNHDAPLTGKPYWSFLSSIGEIRFITKPTAQQDLLLLPHSANPKTDWAGISWSPYRCAMMHQTGRGVIENGRDLDPDPNMIRLPRNLPIYSGDIHTPQRAGPITYVGSPHPIKFGDQYLCRMLLLDDDYSLVRQIVLHPPRKIIAEVSTLRDLQNLGLHPGDQVQIRYSMLPDQMSGWPVTLQEIQSWGSSIGISIASVEAIVMLDTKGTIPDERGVALDDPFEVLATFAEVDGIDETLLEVGKELLREKLDSE